METQQKAFVAETNQTEDKKAENKVMEDLGNLSINKDDNRPQHQGKSQANKKCYNCGESNHFAKDCPNASEKTNAKKCYNCNREGHISRDCPDASNRSSNNNYRRGGGDNRGYI